MPCDTTYAFSFGIDQWFLNRNQGVNVQDAWTINRGRSDVIIAVCDGGVDYTHPNLDPGNRSRVIAGYDTGNNDNDPMDDLPDVPNSFANHGTHIAGIIGANPTSTHHISGVMQNCKIMPIKVVGSGGIKYPFRDVYVWDFSSTAFPSDIADGIDYAVNHGAHVINLSIGFWFPNIPLTDVISGLNVLVSAINNAYNNNVLVIASMGNEGNNGSPYQFPAKLPHVLAVGATDQSQQKVNFSSVGSHISVCAPGVSILSTVRNGGAVTKNGTSMATPVVCGVAGLIISQGKDRGFNLTNDDVRQILERTADDVGTPGFDNETGHGIVNAYSALQLLSFPNNLIHGISYGGSSNKINTLNQWILSSPCYGLAAGVYLDVDQYQITKHITFDTPFLSPPVVWLRERESLSLSFANPNDGRSYVEITNITNTGFDIRYAAYYVRYNSIWQTINRWIPENLSSTKIAYTAVGVPAPQISGPSTICNQDNFTIINPPPGATITWSASNNNLTLVSGQGTSSALFSKNSNGLCQVDAVVNVGGTTINLSVDDIVVGIPPVQRFKVTNMSIYPYVPVYVDPGEMMAFLPYTPVSLVPEHEGMNTSLECSIQTSGNFFHTKSSNPLNPWITFDTPPSPTSFWIDYRYRNACGWSPWYRFNGFSKGGRDLFGVYPNPATDMLTVELATVALATSQTEDGTFLFHTSVTRAPYTIQLWHERNGLVRTVQSTESIVQVSLQGLPKGMYFVHLVREGQVTRKQLLWVR